jgi:hypothetical protein
MGRPRLKMASECVHLHVDRREFAAVAERVRAFRPDAVVEDAVALTRADVVAGAAAPTRGGQLSCCREWT